MIDRGCVCLSQTKEDGKPVAGRGGEGEERKRRGERKERRKKMLQECAGGVVIRSGSAAKLRQLRLLKSKASLPWSNGRREELVSSTVLCSYPEAVQLSKMPAAYVRVLMVR